MLTVEELEVVSRWLEAKVAVLKAQYEQQTRSEQREIFNVVRDEIQTAEDWQDDLLAQLAALAQSGAPSEGG